ncbi:MAG: TlpA disulfide reductase family protein, partial [Nitrososphaerales archaeon]
TGAAVSGSAGGAAFPRAAATTGAAAANASGSNAKAPAVPETLPDVRMPDLNGTERSLHDFLGHPLIVNFWATWCEPCRREMPLLQQLWTRHRPEGLDVVGIAVDSRAAVQQYLRTTHVGYPLLVGEDAGSAAMARFGIQPVLPFSVFADAKGRIVAVKIGELHQADANFIIAAVEQVTQGRESLPRARAAIAAELKQLAVQRAKQATQSGG